MDITSHHIEFHISIQSSQPCGFTVNSHLIALQISHCNCAHTSIRNSLRDHRMHRSISDSGLTEIRVHCAHIVHRAFASHIAIVCTHRYGSLRDHHTSIGEALLVSKASYIVYRSRPIGFNECCRQRLARLKSFLDLKVVKKYTCRTSGEPRVVWSPALKTSILFRSILCFGLTDAGLPFLSSGCCLLL